MPSVQTLIMKLGAATACALLLITTAFAHADERTPRPFDIGPQSLATALSEFARQGQQEILFAPQIVADKQVVGLRGTFLPLEALEKILEDTGLTFSTTPSGAILVQPLGAATTGNTGDAGPHRYGSAPGGLSTNSGRFTLAQADQAASAVSGESDEDNSKTVVSQDLPAPEEAGKAIPELLVRGGKILNMDIRRSRDDAQPYVIFDRATLEQSGAVDLDEFLKTRLTQNTVSSSSNQLVGIPGNTSRINLRGLGANQTLILIDGRRAASINGLGAPGQPDLNGIPIAAVERIEVLPSTASGIYGGGATGGVVNVVLRRDYAGAELKVSYDNTFDSDSAINRLDVSGGFNLEDGRTNVLLAASYSDANPLELQDREFLQEARRKILARSGIAALEVGTSPPLGATTNIRSTNGANLVLKDGTPLNASRTFVPAGYAGAAADGGHALIANAGNYNLDLANSAQNGGGGLQGLLNNPTVKSLLATVRRQFGANVQAFVEMGTSRNHGELPGSGVNASFLLPRTASSNPFDQDVRVTVPTSATDAPFIAEHEERRAVGGVIVRLPGDWRAEADYTWNRSQYYSAFPPRPLATAATAVASGAIDVVRDTNAFPVDFSSYLDAPLVSDLHTTMKTTALRFAGPVGNLPAGQPTLSTLLERREEFFSDGVQGTVYIPSRAQSVNSAYLEAKVPLISARNRIVGVRELDLQLAIRRDDYTVEGSPRFVFSNSTVPIDRRTNKTSSTNPTVGIRYQVVPDLMLRASYGTGFLPPSVEQLIPAPIGPGGTFIDPRRGNELVQISLRSGGNEDLLPEESESWSAGLVFAPHFAPGLRLSLDWTRIDKTDNIVTLREQQIINDEALFPDRITRGPLPANDPFGVGPILVVDNTLINVARARAEAFDLALNYTLDTAGHGSFDFFALATRQTRYRTQLLLSVPTMDNVGITSSFPLEFKANAGLTWRRGNWTLGWAARYFDSYLVADPAVPSNATVIRNQGNDGRVPSQIYHDVFASYVLPTTSAALDAGGLLANAELQAGIKNVFDAAAPFDASNVRYFSYFGDQRGVSYYVSVKVGF